MKNKKLTFSTLSDIKNQLNELFINNPKAEFNVNVSEWKGKRRLPANNQQHLWYGQIAKFYGDRSALEVKNFCKDAFGLPILSNSVLHGDKIEFLLCKLDYYKHSYESKIKLIQCLEVTSLFNTQESKQYMEQMLFYFNDIGINIKFEN